MKTSTDHYTLRSRALLESPEFEKKGHRAEFQDEFSVQFDSHDNILTVHYISCEIPLKNIFMEVLARFSRGQTLLHVLGIHFREIENFLRDENHLPAFPEIHADFNKEALVDLLDEVKFSFVTHALRAKNPGFLELGLILRDDWSKQSLLQKNLWATKLLAETVDILGAKRSLQLILCEESSMTIEGFLPGMNEKNLALFFVKLLFGESKKILPIKVVAV